MVILLRTDFVSICHVSSWESTKTGVAPVYEIALTEAIYAYGFLDSTSVVAEKGKNVMTALEDDVPKVVNLVPNRVIMLYGMNDLECFEDLI